MINKFTEKITQATAQSNKQHNKQPVKTNCGPLELISDKVYYKVDFFLIVLTIILSFNNKVVKSKRALRFRDTRASLHLRVVLPLRNHL